MSTTKKTVKPAVKSTAAKKPSARPKAPKAQKAANNLKVTNDEQVMGPLPDEEVVENMDTVAEDFIFGKNQNRTYALREVWFENLKEIVNDKSVPQENKDEIMFLTLTNAMFDLFMDIVPKEDALCFARNLDDYLSVTLVNKEYGVDLLKTFQKDFTEDMGDKFDTDDKLMAALGKFEEKWWSDPRRDLKGLSPNEALEEMTKKYDSEMPCPMGSGISAVLHISHHVRSG